MEHSEYLRRINQWKSSEGYAKQYSLFQSKIDHVMSVFERSKLGISHMAIQYDKIAERTEIGSMSDLHRGYYCPSLIFDIVVGNVKRGRLLKHLTSRSKKYYVYGFDNTDRMIWCKQFSNASMINVEYLVYEGDFRYGFKLNAHNSLFSVTQEHFQDGRIKSYLYGCGYQNNGEIVWVEWTLECYSYDEAGLLNCDVFRACPAIMDLIHDKLTFKREDGYLKNYYRETLVGFEEPEVVRTSPVYNVTVKRKA